MFFSLGFNYYTTMFTSVQTSPVTHILSLTSHHTLTFLLDHLPPQMHLVTASRAAPPLPIARLRGRGQLTELRLTDLLHP
jgi:hypothetical protein